MSQDASEPSLPPDAALVTAVMSGDREALATLFRRHARSVYRFSLQMTGATDVADDVTQEVFMALARSGGGYAPAQGALSTYLYGIARNLVRQREKRRRARREVDLAALDTREAPVVAPVDPVDQLARHERVAALRRAILRLPAHYREVIVLCDLHALSYDETAAIVGRPVGTIRSRLSRARRLLSNRCRALLDGPAPDGRWTRALSGAPR